MERFVAWAARVEGRDGWLLGLSPDGEGVARREIEVAGHRPSEIRALFGGRARHRLSLVGDAPDGWVADQARGLNWAFDAAVAGWRAPGEAIAPPAGEPSWCGELATAFGKPHAGWITWVLGAPGQSAVVSCSQVFDPFPDLLRFLEGVADGGFPRLSIDEEGHVAQFHALPAAIPEGRSFEDPFRLSLLGRPGQAGDTVLFDVAMPRRAFVSDVYRAWSTALRQHRAAFLAEWFSYFHLDDPAHEADPAGAVGGRDFERVRSPVLDRILQGPEGGTGAA